jgi:pimeloyl-ACP methyl ester carboxylesterase
MAHNFFFKSGVKASIMALTLLFVIQTSAQGADKGTVSGIALVNGAKLYYEMRGKGPTLVLIHGGLVDSRMWDDQFNAFAKHYRVIRYDLRGFGRSEFSMGPLSHIDDLYALLKFLRVEKATVLGLSLGGMVATDFTLEHPEMVERLILAGSALRGFQYPRDPKRLAIDKAAEEQGKEKAIRMWLDYELFATAKNNPVFQKRMKEMLSDNYRTWGPTPAPIVWTWPQTPTVERLGEIKKPTLVIIGDKDVPGTIAIADALHTKITGAKKIVIKNVSHHLNMEKPKEFNQAVLDFMKEKPGRKA